MDEQDFRFDRNYKETVRLRDGMRVTLRPILASDKQLLLEGFERLSPQSRYARFLAPKRRLSDAELRYLTEVDGIEGGTLVVTFPIEAPTPDKRRNRSSPVRRALSYIAQELVSVIPRLTRPPKEPE